jgi:hypothetical protein
VSEAQASGWPTIPVSGIWLRGRARHDRGYIRLDREATEEYALYTATDLLLERLTNVHRPGDALRFARNYGLLFTPPNAEELAEPFDAWEACGLMLRAVIQLHIAACPAVLDRHGVRELRDRIGLVESYLTDTPRRDLETKTREELREIAFELVARLINGHLENVRLRVTSATSWTPPLGPPGAFLYAPIVSNPVEAAYYQLTRHLTARRELRACEECGALFPVRDRRQRFHEPRCATRARQRRLAMRKAQENRRR